MFFFILQLFAIELDETCLRFLLFPFLLLLLFSKILEFGPFSLVGCFTTVQHSIACSVSTLDFIVSFRFFVFSSSIFFYTVHLSSYLVLCISLFQKRFGTSRSCVGCIGSIGSLLTLFFFETVVVCASCPRVFFSNKFYFVTYLLWWACLLLRVWVS